MTVQATLRDTTNRLFYEWWMLGVAEQMLAQSALDRATQNAWIEVGAIHGRNLADFLYYNGPDVRAHDDDVSAEDFIPRTKWREARTQASPALSRHEFREPVNKQIAHLTKSANPKKEWDFSIVADALQPAIEIFFALVSREDLGDRWSQELTQMSGRRWDGVRRVLAERGDG
jgi:hypothetical protein